MSRVLRLMFPPGVFIVSADEKQLNSRVARSVSIWQVVTYIINLSWCDEWIHFIEWPQ